MTGGFEIGDGAGDFQDAVVGARGKAEALDGGFQRASRRRREMAQYLRISLGGICALA